MTSAQQKLRMLISKQHPGFPIKSFEIIGEGLENVAAEVNGNIIIRFAKESIGKEAINREAQLLETLARVDSVRIPVPIAEPRGKTYYSYSKIVGLPLILVLDQMTAEELSSICRIMGRFLSELHTIPVRLLDGLFPVDEEPFEDLLKEASNTFDIVKDLIPDKAHAGVLDFLGSTLPKKPAFKTLIHNDLGIEHLIVNFGNATKLGVIDWSDSAIGDPAVDFSRIYRDLGSERLNEVLREYKPKSESVEEISKRIVFYARCSIFEELAYGREPGHEIYLSRANEALQRMFPIQD